MEQDFELIVKQNRINTLDTVYNLYIQSLSDKKVSYIPYLIDINYITEEEIKKGKSIGELNNLLTKMKMPIIEDKSSEIFELNNLTTIEIIKHTDFLFSSTITNENIKNIINVLKNRKDLFEVLIEYTNTFTYFPDDFFYWFPDLDFSDTLSLLISLYDENELISKYKKYLQECLILNLHFKEGLYKLLTERFNSSIFSHINVMKKDLEIFPTNNTRKSCKKIVSTEYWDTSNYKCSTKLRQKLIKDEYMCDKYSEKEFEFFLCDSLTYVTFTIKGQKEVNLTLSLEYLDDFTNGGEKFRDFWIKEKILNVNGKYLI
ncbi:hypothetical protein GVAV_001378 [Gurleya vavrai]